MKNTDEFTTAEEWAHYMIDILQQIDKIEGTPACYNPKPYLKIIKKAVKVGKLAISKYDNINLKKDEYIDYI